MKALLLENIHSEGVRLLTERGIEVETVKGALDEAELIDALRGVQRPQELYTLDPEAVT